MEIIERYIEEIVRRLGNNLRALILVGSFARGEGIEGLSDMEFVEVVKNVQIVRNGEDGKNVSIKFTTGNHFKRLKPYIFTIELKKYGKVLWGDKKILELIPDYSYEDIDPKDGFILLNNRIVEQLIIWQKASSGQHVRHYDVAKGYIQLVNSYLAVNRTYKSLYPEKQEEFNRVYKGNGYLKDKVNQAFAFLKQPENRILAQDDALRQWKELRNYYRQLWKEQVRIFAKPSSFIERIKGWVKVLVDPRKRSLFSCTEITANIFKTSPQFIIYQQAAGEYFSNNQNAFKISRIIKQWEAIVK